MFLIANINGFALKLSGPNTYFINIIATIKIPKVGKICEEDDDEEEDAVNLEPFISAFREAEKIAKAIRTTDQGNPSHSQRCPRKSDTRMSQSCSGLDKGEPCGPYFPKTLSSLGRTDS